MIYTKEVLDRETQSYYWLTVYAHDSATVPRSSFVDVLIEVDDVNDNRPQTAQPVYYPTVLEGSRERTEVIQLQALDYDMANGELTYDISSGNPQGFFAVDRITGTYFLSDLTLPLTIHTHCVPGFRHISHAVRILSVFCFLLFNYVNAVDVS